MAARASLDALILRVRKMIADPVGLGEYWDDDAIQAALDDYRTDSRYDVLTPAPTPRAGSLADEYLDYYSAQRVWEDDYTLWDSTYAAPLTPVLLEPQVGHWAFASPGVNPPVFIKGKTFDLYSAAADLLDQRLVDPAEGITFTTEGGATFQLHEIRDSWCKLRDKYRALAPHSVSRVYSSEDQPDYLTNTGPGGGYYAP